MDSSTSSEVLRDYFTNYGPVDYVNIVGTEATVVFKNARTVNLVLSTQPHFIRGRQVILRIPATDLVQRRFNISPFSDAAL